MSMILFVVAAMLMAPTVAGRCSGQNDGCCTKDTPCNIGEGDCDNDQQCAGSLICGDNNCPWGDNDACCREGIVPGPNLGKTDWGDWTKYVTCPSGKKVTGFRLQVEGEQYGLDDTAVNGIQLKCQRDTTSEKIKYKWGTWTAWKTCDADGYVIELDLKGMPAGGIWKDDYGATNVRIKCSGGETKIGDGLSRGVWVGYRRCPPRTFLCGARAKIEEVGAGDDTALNRIQIGCCHENEGVCPLIGISYDGHDVKQIKNVDSWEACGELCKTDDECYAWTYVSDNFHRVRYRKRCDLKKPTYEQGTAALTNLISGPKGCGVGSCPLIGISYDGHDVKQIRNVDSWEACGVLCKMDDECYAWTYVSDNFHRVRFRKRCDLKKPTYGQGTAALTNLISGPKGCVAE